MTAENLPPEAGDTSERERFVSELNMCDAESVGDSAIYYGYARKVRSPDELQQIAADAPVFWQDYRDPELPMEMIVSVDADEIDGARIVLIRVPVKLGAAPPDMTR